MPFLVWNLMHTIAKIEKQQEMSFLELSGQDGDGSTNDRRYDKVKKNGVCKWLGMILFL